MGRPRETGRADFGCFRRKKEACRSDAAAAGGKS